MRKRIFIGSSSEELGTAKTVKSILENDFEVVIWDENLWDKSVFKLNGNFLNNLLSATLKFDFGIIIGSPDDKITSRGKEGMTARDNILFELGLFIGRLGLENCAFLVENSVKIPSDFAGIKVSKFNKDNLVDRINEIKDFFGKTNNTDLNFFPSRILAYSYYENFVRFVAEHIIHENGFIYKNKTYKNSIFKIIVPTRLSEDLNMQFKKMQNEIETERVSFSSSGRTRSITIDSATVEDDNLLLLDFPTTLTGINHAIMHLLPRDFRNNNKDYELILARELDKFVDTLEVILKKNNYSDFIIIERRDSLK